MKRADAMLPVKPTSDVRVALLVDDEADSRAAQQTRLEGEGYTVFVATNQADALSRAKQALPQVICVHLATGGTVQLIQALRSDDSCRHIPVVVLKDQPQLRAVPGRARLHAIPHDSW
ncbi:MAG: response regulator [Chloroflexi bacterium]|nr:MAG: response regulator [Chloroflexota bacterium]